LGDILWKTTRWMEDLPLLRIKTRINNLSECELNSLPSEAHDEDLGVLAVVGAALGARAGAEESLPAEASGCRLNDTP
jgi:hypothetical protein